MALQALPEATKEDAKEVGALHNEDAEIKYPLRKHISQSAMPVPRHTMVRENSLLL